MRWAVGGLRSPRAGETAGNHFGNMSRIFSVMSGYVVVWVSQGLTLYRVSVFMMTLTRHASLGGSTGESWVSAFSFVSCVDELRSNFTVKSTAPHVGSCAVVSEIWKINTFHRNVSCIPKISVSRSRAGRVLSRARAALDLGQLRVQLIEPGEPRAVFVQQP